MNNKGQRRFAVLAGGLVALLGFQAVLAVAQEDAAAQEGAATQEGATTQESSAAQGGTFAPDDKSPFSFSVSQTFFHDSNLYRLPDECPGVSNPTCGVPKDKRSDFVSDTRASVNFDKQYGRQAFHAGLGVSHTIYNTHSDLNNTVPNANLRWDWRAGDRLSGTFGYNYSESFVGFDDTHAGANLGERSKTVRRFHRANGSVDFWWHPNWATGFGYSSVNNDYRNNARSYDEYDAQEVSVNFTYRPSTGNRIVLSYSGEEGQYPNRGKDPGSLRDWERRDARLSGQWRLTGVTQLNGYVGHTTRKYDLAHNRDFSGVTGKIGLHWMPTGKTILDLSWRREIGADADLVSNYAVSQGWAVRPTWVATSKIRLGASYEYLKRDYRGDPGFGLLMVLPRNAKTTAYGVNLQYIPVPYASINIRYQYQERDAVAEMYNFSARTISLTGSITF